MSSLREWIEQRAVRELAEVKRVPATLVIVFALGLILGWSVARSLSSERIALLELQRDAAMEKIAAPASPATISANWPLWTIAGTALLVSVFVVVRSRRKDREIRSLVKQVDVLQDSIRTGSKERQHVIDERDTAIAALKDKKHEYAMKVLEAYETLTFKDKGKPHVTVRFARYDRDEELAQRIKGLFSQYVKWDVRLDGSNNPALPRSDDFKVVFDVGMLGMNYGELVHAFSEGDLLGVPVGVQRYVDRDDIEHLIVKVLPSDGAQPIKADPA